MNPYSPPCEQPSLERPRRSHRRARQLVTEAAQAFFTIVGILFGWTLIGIGELGWTSRYSLLGIFIIGTTCLFALGIRIGGPSSGGKRKGTVEITHDPRWTFIPRESCRILRGMIAGS